MWDKLESLVGRVAELERLMTDPSVVGNSREMQRVGRELSELRPLVDAHARYRKIARELEENRELQETEKDPEIRSMAREEIARLSAEQEAVAAEIRLLLLPRDPNDEKNILIEIRAGAGGEEAALFATELFRAYSMYAALKGWKVEVLSRSETGLGGTKEVIAMIEGKGAYSRLKFESGVHRVQRVPATESGGRIHTSTVTVAVMPEAEEVDVQINPDDLRIDVFRSSGPGGQSVNTTDSAVRITHIPTGLVVQCQDEKSQLKNKSKALKILRSRLYDLEMEKQRAERADLRRSQVGTGDRSERIRTYNFPQSRVTDHRIGFTVHQLSPVLDGGFDPFIDALVANAQVEALKTAG
ncbi:MAG: peptide chain release factor 1 [Deltaproteobacteria bacterium]|nr:MAG: peptide chain release factor 1 [Deltaproteobacteria bacterium]